MVRARSWDCLRPNSPLTREFVENSSSSTVDKAQGFTYVDETFYLLSDVRIQVGIW